MAQRPSTDSLVGKGMDFQQTAIAGVFLVTSSIHRDNRGGFLRTFCQTSFANAGLAFKPSQWSESYNTNVGTLRGLHLQGMMGEECKLVRCLSGRILDVAVDVRSKSETFGKYVSVVLEAGDGRALFIPEGFAHGFQTLTDHTTVGYAISPDYTNERSYGIRWNDPTIAINWSLESPAVISERDARLPTFEHFVAERGG